MNYRHIYHAGNFADVMKHLVLFHVIDHFKKKETGFCVLDAHAGIGLYDLTSIEAQKTGEWQSGIGRFDNIEIPADFAIFQNQIKADLTHHRYPGSPLQIARMLRPQDRMIANELHPQDVEELKDNLKNFKNARIDHKDAYECIRANIPPAEKRGLILIDPPFEKKDEFDILIRQMKEWKKRFSNGVFLLWYPIKPHLAIDDMKDAARSLDMSRTWCFETLKYPRYQTQAFNGCGVILFNAPFQVPERIETLRPFLSARMGLIEAPCEWLTPP